MKQISDFTKAELIAHMRASGEIRRSDRDSKAWKRAFKLFEQEQGMAVDMDCGKCWSKVSAWLNADDGNV